MRDSGIEEKALGFLDSYFDNHFISTAPVNNKNIPLQLPCQFVNILKNYGWNWDSVSNQQVFCNGILMQVNDNSPVLPIASGKVEQIIDGGNEEGFSILVKHDESFYSYYGKLNKPSVSAGDNLSLVKPIGLSSGELYLELRNQEGPIDPRTVFQEK
jgi:murein DD-endopeptidase MepM/ murein hydrolase activator NlpD